jgi:hypothetical protein
MLIVYGTHTLINVIIIDSTCTNFILQIIFFEGMDVTIVAQAKLVTLRLTP